MEYDVFLSHATEDKDSFVRPLADELKKLGLQVWYDEFSLTPGDSIRQSIDKGLRNSRYGVVVLSRNFFKKSWTEWEINGLIQRHLSEGRNVIIPVWHEVDVKTVASFSPSLADIVAILSSRGISNVANQIFGVVGKDIKNETTNVDSEPFPKATLKSDETRLYKLQLNSSLSSLRMYALHSLKTKDTPGILQLGLVVPVENSSEVSFVTFASYPEIFEETIIPKSSSLIGYSFNKATTIKINDLNISDKYYINRTYMPEQKQIPQGSIMAIPISKKDSNSSTVEVLGVLSMSSSKINFFGGRNKNFFENLNILAQDMLLPSLTLFNKLSKTSA